MKRSRVVRLALLGSASALALAACEEAKDPLADKRAFFEDPAQCARVYDDATCQAAFDQAKVEHVQTAPKFASREECEEKFGVGNCQWGQAQPGQQQASGGGGFFMPLMMGYLMGNMMGRPLQPGLQQPVPPAGSTSSSTSSSSARSSSSFSSSPVYRDTRNTVYSGSRALGTTSISAAPTSRGGFGSSSRSYSSSASS
jgi:uncharacterized protein YgiB involved in biofilm formation